MIEREHVRRPQPPWRTGNLTECGLAADSYPTISRDDLETKLRQQGQRRAAMSTCMTCLDTARRWPTWEEDPVRAISRETYGGRTGDPGFRTELLAMAALIQLHRDEFASLLADLEDMPPTRRAPPPDEPWCGQLSIASR